MTDANHVPLREYIEGVLDEQRRGTLLAEREREKAAAALRVELSRAIQEGDERLREHIDQQFRQIAAALESAEKLEVERIAKVSADMAGLNREIRIGVEASEQAIAKAEAATERRFESVNAFREQLSAQTASFLPREVAEAQFVEIRRALQELTDKLNKIAG